MKTAIIVDGLVQNICVGEISLPGLECIDLSEYQNKVQIGDSYTNGVFYVANSGEEILPNVAEEPTPPLNPLELKIAEMQAVIDTMLNGGEPA